MIQGINQHSHNLRTNDDSFLLHIPKPHKEIFKSTYSYMSAVNWNSLPLIVRSSQSINTFLHLCKQYLLDNGVPT